MDFCTGGFTASSRKFLTEALSHSSSFNDSSEHLISPLMLSKIANALDSLDLCCKQSDLGCYAYKPSTKVRMLSADMNMCISMGPNEA